MFSSFLDALLKLSKTSSPQNFSIMIAYNAIQAASDSEIGFPLVSGNELGKNNYQLGFHQHPFLFSHKVYQVYHRLE